MALAVACLPRDVSIPADYFTVLLTTSLRQITLKVHKVVCRPVGHIAGRIAAGSSVDDAPFAVQGPARCIYIEAASTFLSNL